MRHEYQAYNAKQVENDVQQQRGVRRKPLRHQRFYISLQPRVGRTRSAEGALCTNLANGNVGNFHSKVQEGRTVSTRYMRGAVDPISL